MKLFRRTVSNQVSQENDQLAKLQILIANLSPNSLPTHFYNTALAKIWSLK